MKIPKFLRSCIVCDCGSFDNWHISADDVCYGPGMSESEASAIYRWLIYNEFIPTKEWVSI